MPPENIPSAPGTARSRPPRRTQSVGPSSQDKEGSQSSVPAPTPKRAHSARSGQRLVTALPTRRPRLEEYTACEGSDPSAPGSQLSRIKVVVRKRPPKVSDESVDHIYVHSYNAVTVFEPKERVDCTRYFEEHRWMFDDVFDETDNNRNVYRRAARPLVDIMFSGGYATCFAFGQTGSGKTHTTLGNNAEPGLFFLAAEDIFQRLPGLGAGDHLLHVSFFEIYQKKIYDLLQGRKECYAREAHNKKLHIAPLCERVVASASHLGTLIREGSDLRQSGSTGANAQSSRSHAILQISLRSPTGRFAGQLSFIDLAGSERGGERGLDGITEGEKQTLREGIEINRSLLALKECIRALDAPRSLQQRIPFRDSKLTEVLRPSFTGAGTENRQTVMIATVAPNTADLDHTLNTLRYAYMVKQLKPLEDFFASLEPSTPPAPPQIRKKRHRPGKMPSRSSAGDLMEGTLSEEEGSIASSNQGVQKPKSGGSRPGTNETNGSSGVDRKKYIRQELKSQLGHLQDQIDLITTRRVARAPRKAFVPLPDEDADEEFSPNGTGDRRVNVGLDGETVKTVQYYVEEEPTPREDTPDPCPITMVTPPVSLNDPPATWPPAHALAGKADEGQLEVTTPCITVESQVLDISTGVTHHHRSSPKPQLDAFQPQDRHGSEHRSRSQQLKQPETHPRTSPSPSSHTGKPHTKVSQLLQENRSFADSPPPPADHLPPSSGGTPSTPLRLTPIASRKPPIQVLVQLGVRRRLLQLPTAPSSPFALRDAALQLFEVTDHEATNWVLEWWSSRFNTWVELQDAAEAVDGATLRLTERLCDSLGLMPGQQCLKAWLTHHHLVQHFATLLTEGYDDIASLLSLEATQLQSLGWRPGHIAKLQDLAQTYRTLLKFLRKCGLLAHLGTLLCNGYDSLPVLRAATAVDMVALGIPDAHAQILCSASAGIREQATDENEEQEEDEEGVEADDDDDNDDDEDSVV